MVPFLFWKKKDEGCEFKIFILIISFVEAFRLFVSRVNPGDYVQFDTCVSETEKLILLKRALSYHLFELKLALF